MSGVDSADWSGLERTGADSSGVGQGERTRADMSARYARTPESAPRRDVSVAVRSDIEVVNFQRDISGGLERASKCVYIAGCSSREAQYS